MVDRLGEAWDCQWFCVCLVMFDDNDAGSDCETRGSCVTKQDPETGGLRSKRACPDREHVSYCISSGSCDKE